MGKKKDEARIVRKNKANKIKNKKRLFAIDKILKKLKSELQ